MKQAAVIVSGLAILVIAGLVLYGGADNQVMPDTDPAVTTEATSENPVEVTQTQTTPEPVSETNQSDVTSMNENLLAFTHNAVVATNQGTFTLGLYGNAVPNTVENFVTLSNDGFYNDTKFHRIIEGFMIQGGDPNSKFDDEAEGPWGTGGPGYSFADEFVPELSNGVGTISMANSGPNTNGSQFFVNVADNAFLNGWDTSTPSGHSVFGLVTEGYDVVEMLSQVGTDGRDRPLEPVVVQSITISEVAPATKMPPEEAPETSEETLVESAE